MMLEGDDVGSGEENGVVGNCKEDGDLFWDGGQNGIVGVADLKWSTFVGISFFEWNTILRIKLF